jgi:hypothetical protein
MRSGYLSLAFPWLLLSIFA